MKIGSKQPLYLIITRHGEVRLVHEEAAVEESAPSKKMLKAAPPARCLTPLHNAFMSFRKKPTLALKLGNT
jgi:hypothetical protein